MNNTMIYKLQVLFESGLIMLSIHWQPVFGIISACAAAWYYLAMLKMNVVDQRHDGSWRKYLKSIITNIIKGKK